jgi:hypothetical protein
MFNDIENTLLDNDLQACLIGDLNAHTGNVSEYVVIDNNQVGWPIPQSVPTLPFTKKSSKLLHKSNNLLPYLSFLCLSCEHLIVGILHSILVIAFFGLRLMKDCYCKKPYLEWFIYHLIIVYIAILIIAHAQCSVDENIYIYIRISKRVINMNIFTKESSHKYTDSTRPCFTILTIYLAEL